MRFEAHLSECPLCLNYLDQMRQAIDTLGELTEGVDLAGKPESGS